MFEYEGQIFSLEELKTIAKNEGKDFNTFMSAAQQGGLTATRPIYRKYFPKNAPTEPLDLPVTGSTHSGTLGDIMETVGGWFEKEKTKLDLAIEATQIEQPMTVSELNDVGVELQLQMSPKVKQLKTRLNELPSTSPEALDIEKEIEAIKVATKEAGVNPNLKSLENKVNIIKSHEDKKNKIKETVEAAGGTEEDVQKQIDFYESNNPEQTTIETAKFDVKIIEDGLGEITTIRAEDFYSGFGKKANSFEYLNEEEQIELSKLLKQQMIEDISIKDFQKAQEGYFTGDEKEAIINKSKYKIIEKEITKANEIWMSSRFLDFKKEKEIIQNKLEEYAQYDEEGRKLLIPEFETQEDVDAYNDLVERANALNVEGENLANIIKASEERLETLYAELGFNAIEGVFDNNFEMTDEYQNWKDNHLKEPRGTADYKQGVVLDALGTFVQEGLKTAADATIGTSLWLANWGYSKTDKGRRLSEGKYYTANDLMNDVYRNYTRGNWLGISDKDAMGAWEGIKQGDVRSMSKSFMNTLPFTIGIVMAARNGNFKPAKSLWSSLAPKFVTSPKGRANIRIWDATFRMQTIGNYHEGKDLGLSNEEAIGYSAFKSAGEATVQWIMPDQYFFGSPAGKGILTSVVTNLKGAANKKAIGSAVMTGFKNILKEQPEEYLQVMWGDVAKVNAGIYHSPDFLDAEVVKETIAGTLLLTGGIAPVGAINNYNDVKKQIYNQYKNRGEEIINSIDDELKVVESHLKKATTEGAKAQYQTIIDQLTEAKSYGQSIINAVNSAPDKVSDAQIDLLIEKQKLVREKEDKDKAAVAGIDEQIKILDEKIANSAIRKREVEITGKIKTTIEEAIEKGDLKGDITEMTSEEIANIDEEGFDSKTAAKEHGFIAQNPDGSFNIILNKDKEMVGTAAHEFLHAALFKTIGNNKEIQDKLGDALIDHAADLGGDLSPLGKRLQAYGKFVDGEFVRDDNFGEEVITIMSESIIDGSLKFEESLFTKIGDNVRRFLQKVGIKKVKFNTGKDVFNFVKDYSKNIKEGKIDKAILNIAAEGVEGELVGEQVDPKAGVQMSKVNQRVQQFLDLNIDNKSLVSITEAPQSTQEDRFAAFETLLEKNWPIISKALKFNPTGEISMESVKEAVSEQMLGIFPRVILPNGKSIARKTPLFKTYNKEMAVTTFLDATLKPRQAEILTRAKTLDAKTRAVDISEARDIAVPAEAPITQAETKRPKINVLKFSGLEAVVDKIIDLVKPKKGDTFKQIISKHAGKVGQLVFDIPAEKIMKGGANLIPTTKYKEGMPIPSEAQNIQKFFQSGENMGRFIKSLPLYNVAKPTADITEQGENIPVSRDVYGNAIGLKGLPQNYFYEDWIDPTGEITSPSGRSKGLKSQTPVKRLKARFINPAPEVIERAKRDIGITRKGEQNIYDRDIGQLLKGFAKTYSINASLSAAQRNLEAKIKEAKEAKKEKEAQELRQQTADITAAQSIYAFSKVEEFSQVSGEFEMDNVKHADDLLNAFTLQGIYRHRTRTEIDEWFDDVENVLIANVPESILPKSRLASFLRPSNRIFPGKKFGFEGKGKDIINVDGKKMSIDDYYKLKREKLLAKDLTYGENFTGEAENYRYGKTYGQMFGESEKEIAKSFLDGTAEAYNRIHLDMHKQLWSRINKSIKDTKGGSARAWASWLSLVGQDVTHPHRMGAELLGYSINPKGVKVKDKTKLYEWEHAMPATRAYLFLLEAALDKDFDFDASYGLVMNNFKLIALDAAEDLKLKNAGRTTSMGENWSIVTDSWLDRYFDEIVAGVRGGINPSSIMGFNNVNFAEQFNINAEGKPAILKTQINKNKTLNKAWAFSRSANNESKGITVLDFDDTLATTKSLVKYTAPDGTKGTLNAEEYASTYQDLLEQKYKFDFTEFDKVVKGKIAPLFQKALKLQGKFGPENMFVLTARPPAAQKPIFDFLKANGLNIPLKNITGLGNSTSEAKALWIADKVGEGYNDFYFADDALQNVQAVKNMLDQFDVKSKVQQAKVKFSKDINVEFNDILEDVTGIESKKRFSDIKARKRGSSKGKFRFFIPPSHEDFTGLLYNFMGKGKKGNAHRDFFEKTLIRPLNRAYRELNVAKQSVANDYKSLNKEYKEVREKLLKKTPDGDFTYQDAVRVYIWTKHNYDVPGLTPTDQTNLSELVASDTDLQNYAEALNIISKQDTYVSPDNGWEAGDIRTDLDDATGRIGRKQYLAEFFENADIIFSQENLNKIEAAYGVGVKSAIEDILYRTKTGRNRPSGQNKLVNQFMNYLNGSVAATMFFNIRSAVLQQMSMVNYINYADNNIFTAAKAFANQKQYWNDWAFIFNSDMIKQRRGGIKTDVNGAELAASLRNAKNTPRALLAKLLEYGFLPTQIGDNIAIATGGATFYRNRINTYKKQGFNEKEAESKAWTDFEVLTEATQQSARPDMVSQQQASPLGKIILAFQNVTSQFNRLGKKAFLDIKNRRITPGNTTQLQSDISNLSRISYYLVIQNLIFYSLQSALFMALFEDDEDDKRWLDKRERMVNGSIDSVLRGTGVYGAAVSTLKNMAIKWHEQRDKGWNRDESAVLMEMLNVSPPLGIKARKLLNAERTLNYNKNIIEEMETFDIDNPQWSAVTNMIEATTNAPVNRLYNKAQNVRQSLNSDHEAYQRVLLFSGWSQWNLGIGDSEKIKEIKEDIKKKKEKGKKKKKKKFKTFKKFKVKSL